MTDEQKQTSPNDWSQLAKDALDIWQNHLTSLATDPKAKEEMARFVTPMTEAMTGWSNVVQQGMQQMMQMATSAAEQAQEAYAATQAEAPAQPPSEAADAPVQTAADDVPAAPDDAPQPAAEQQPDVTEESASHEQSVPVSPAMAADGGSDATVSVADEPVPVVQPTVEPEPVATAEPAPESRRAAAPDGTRSLAELAGRLAVLERELDQLRPRPRRKDAAAEPGSDGADERVAGADPKPDTL